MESTGCNQRGQVLILLVLMMLTLLAAAGLALDVGMAYVVKTKLSAAVDAAALAAAKVVSAPEGTLDAEATKFFYANYPDGLLGSTVDKPTAVSQYHNSEKSWTVTVSSTAKVPTYFARAVGFPDFTVGASATSTINPVDLVLVMDASSSLGPPTSDERTLPDLKAAAQRFVGLFNPSNDRVGLVYFASGAVADGDVKITPATGFNRDRVISAIGAIERGGYTTAEEALRLAKKQLDDIPVDLRSRLRIIVFFADGAPNGVAANYSTTSGSVEGALSSAPEDNGWLFALDRRNRFLGAYSISTLPGVDYTNTVSMSGRREFIPPATSEILYNDCNVNKAARNMVENVADAARSESGTNVTPITIFTVGLGTNMTDLEIDCGYGPEEYGANIMMRLANVRGVDTYNPDQPTGVYAYAANSSQLDAAFNQVARAILRISK